MVFSKGNMSFIILLLSGSPAQGARVAIHEASVDKTNWGRSCSSLETRFQNQQSRLAESEGNTALVRSVSLMRTLRRANARECEWSTNGDVDTSAAAGMAANYFRQSPCYQPSVAAYTAAQNLPEEERENAMADAVAILLSENDECAPSAGEAPEMNESDEELEEEMDDETDQVMEELATVPSETSLIQQDQPGAILVTGYFSWFFAAAGGWPVIIGSIVVGILLAMFCSTLVHMIVRIFRWIRCKIFGNSCSEYAPATWVRLLVGGGCSLTGMLLGPLGLVFGSEAFGSGLVIDAVSAGVNGR